MDNQQLSSLTCNDDGKSSTTIPEGSTGKKFTGKRPVFLNKFNVIYMIINSKTNKFYIGSAANYAKRMSHHIHFLRKNKHKNPYLQAAWNKYGESSFYYFILKENIDNLLDEEQYCLDKYKPFIRKIGYNLCNRASRNRLGAKMPESAKIKIGNFWRGKKFSKDRLDKHKKRVTLNQGKPVLVYDNNNNFLHSFDSRSEASRILNVSIATVSKQCKNNGKTRSRKDSLYIFKNKDIV